MESGERSERDASLGGSRAVYSPSIDVLRL